MINPNSLIRVLVCLACSGLASSTLAQSPKIEQRLSDPVYMAWLSEPSVSLCVECHLEGPGFGAIVAGNVGKLTQFSRREEMEAWVSQDKHTIARRRVEPRTTGQLEEDLNRLFDGVLEKANSVADALTAKGITIDRNEIGLREVPQEWIGDSNLLSRRICDKLWGKDAVDTPAGYDQFRDACLTCHGGVTPGKTTPRPDNVMTDEMIGIDCLYCHQEGDQKGWQKEHFNSDQWRLATPQYKSSQGMTDLANTSQQASLCLDCHVGNRKKQMFVTHEMYAAGHPPLPAVEVETFCQQMPMHWQTPGQLYQRLQGFPQRDEYFAINYPGVTETPGNDETFWNTRKLFIGALSARRKSVQSYVDSIDQDQWTDYSLYDCAACHHELKSISRRQDRYQNSERFRTPGRPRQHEWHRPLLNVAYRLAGRESYQRVLVRETELSECFDRHPFGISDEVHLASESLLAEIDSILAAVERRPINASLAKATLKVLTQTPSQDLLTYDAARQLAWATRVIGQELQPAGSGLSPEASGIVNEFQVTEVAGLELKLPSGRKQYIYPDALGSDLQRRESFEPDELIRRLRSLNASL